METARRFFIFLFLIPRTLCQNFTEDCGGNIETQNGTISYGLHHWSRVRCQWNITTSTHDIIELRIRRTSFDCKEGYILFYDGFDYNKQLLGKYCNDTVLDVIWSKTEKMQIELYVAELKKDKWLLATFTGRDCGGNLTEKNGLISSPGYPDSYPHDFKCQWNVTAERNEMIELKFSNVHLEDCPSCGCDSVTVYSGNSSNLVLLGKFCNNVSSTLISKGLPMQIVLVTDGGTALSGFTASYNKTCISGWYGLDCNSTCSQNCIQSLNGTDCNHVDGRCLSGCMAGFLGDTCDKICISGFYGPDCNFPCSQNCIKMLNEPACNHVDGRCPNGCMAGFLGDTCDKTCISGLYGPDCNFICSQNCIQSLNGTGCSYVDGRCLSGCMAGFLGDTCEKTCSDNTYGQGCAANCSQFCAWNLTNQQLCDSISGDCVFGCVEGYKGLKCQEPCHDNSYGEGCATKCSQRCAQNKTIPQSCDHINGSCTFGCANGYIGLMCQERTVCDPGSFGDQCQYKCQCEGGNCSLDGSCERGVTCRGGWFGPACQYADIAYNKSTVASHSVVVDGDDSTCLNGVNSTSIDFNLGDKFLLTWLRVRLSIHDLLPTLLVSFGNDGSVECTAARNSTVDKFTMDLYCDMNQTIQHIRVSGDGMRFLCSLYVSGGRDISAGQNISLTSTYVGSTEVESTNVGLTPTPRRKRQLYSFQSTNKIIDKRTVRLYDASWKISFTRPYSIKSAHLSNRAGRESYLLTEFKLQAFDAEGVETFLFEDNRRQMISFYNAWFAPFIAYTVSITVNNSENILQIFDVEIYGETICESDRHGRDCEHRCNCAGSESCFVSTGGCPFGCATGFQGQHCRQACKENTYGPGCSTNCSTFCVQRLPDPQSCHHISGACLHGCVSGFIGHNCQPQTFQAVADDNSSNLKVVWTVLAVICGLLVLILIYTYMGRRGKRRDELLLTYINNKSRVDSIQPSYEEDSEKCFKARQRSEITKQPKTSESSYENDYASLADYDINSTSSDNKDEKQAFEEPYNEIDEKGHSEPDDSEINDDAECDYHIYSSTISLAVNNQEQNTRVLKEIKTPRVSLDTSLSDCYKNLQDEEPSNQAPNPLREQQLNRATASSVIYDDTVVSTETYDGEGSSEHNSEVRTENPEELNTTAEYRNGVYDLPEKCQSSEESSYRNVQDVPTLIDAPYQRLIGLPQDIRDTSSVIYDDTLGSTHSLNKEHSSAEHNQETRTDGKVQLKTTHGINKIVYISLEKGETVYRNMQDVQQSTDATYEEMMGCQQNNNATSKPMFEDTVCSAQPNCRTLSSEVHCQQVKTQEQKETDFSYESVYTNPDTYKTSTDLGYYNIQDVQESTDETYEEIK